MPRLMLSDELLSTLREILCQHRIYDKRDLRMTVEGMLYRLRVGCPWRDLPKAFGCWDRVYKRFNAGSSSGKWLTIFRALVVEPDLEWAFLDGSYARAHQHSARAAMQDAEAIGKSRGGNTTKIHLAVDGYGLPVEFIITAGEVNGCTAAPELIAKVASADVIIADKGYDSERLREQIEAQDSRVVIPRKRNSVKGNGDLD